MIEYLVTINFEFSNLLREHAGYVWMILLLLLSLNMFLLVI